MRPHHRAEPAHRVGCEGHTVTLCSARTYWQAKRSTVGSRAPGKCPKLTHASMKQESIRPSLKSSLRSDVAGARYQRVDSTGKGGCSK